MRYRTFVVISLALLLTGCAQVNFIEGGEKITSKHLSLAIIPPVVNIKNCPDIENVNCLRAINLETEALHQNLFRFVLNRNAKKKYRLRITQKDKVIEKLIEAGINPRFEKDYNKICKILEVDAILVPDFLVSKPTSAGASAAVAVASNLLLRGFGFSTTTNTIEGQLFIYDSKTLQKIWTYKHAESGDFLSSKKGIQNKLMQNIALKLPYY